MILEQFALIAVVVLIVSSATLIISQNWRWSLIALAVQYVGVFWLVALIWPVGLAAVKLVVGWMAGAVLGAARPDAYLLDDPFASFSGRVYRFVAAALILLLMVSVAPMLQWWFPADLVVLQGSLVLIGMGLLQLGMTTQPLRVILGLLTTFAGFEILYAAIESSVLVAGLLGLINLSLALVGAYLLTTLGTESKP
ncbi:MAG: hypothetical protein U1B80_10735 [Anaerolineaceae bacterium]|nr:hypothetical protein [Anaerolineaceae bacterium]